MTRLWVFLFAAALRNDGALSSVGLFAAWTRSKRWTRLYRPNWIECCLVCGPFRSSAGPPQKPDKSSGVNVHDKVVLEIRLSGRCCVYFPESAAADRPSDPPPSQFRPSAACSAWDQSRWWVGGKHSPHTWAKAGCSRGLCLGLGRSGGTWHGLCVVNQRPV